MRHCLFMALDRLFAACQESCRKFFFGQRFKLFMAGQLLTMSWDRY